MIQVKHLLILIVIAVFASFATYEVQKVDFPFVDPLRCRQPDYCGLSVEWDLKFGRQIPATAYYPGNETHVFNVSSMNVLIFAALRSNDKFESILSNISSSGVVVINLHLENKQLSFDYLNDILRVSVDMFYENYNDKSPFYQKLSGSIVIAGFGEMADRLIWINHDFGNETIYSPHSSIKGIISLSPSLWRDTDLLLQAKNMQIPILFIAGSTDAWRPISHQRPIFNQVRVCKAYIEIIGGNHCYFVDDDVALSECYRKEKEYPSTFKESAMSHQYQLNKYSARTIYEYLTFVSNQSIESANAFQTYLIDQRDATNGELQYLQSCYVDNEYFAHDQYFPRDTEQKEYRKVV